LRDSLPGFSSRDVAKAQRAAAALTSHDANPQGPGLQKRGLQKEEQ
jgi:hypothetical protein